MAGVRSYVLWITSAAALAAALTLGNVADVRGQLPASAPLNELPPPAGIVQPQPDELVAEVRVEGNRTKSTTKVLNEIGIRAGRPFERDQLQRDVRKLASKSWFLNVKPEITRAPAGGLIVTFIVIERPVLEYVKYVGNSKVKIKKLAEQTELKAGMARDPYSVEEGQRRIEQYYQEKGYNGVKVTILEGTKPKDRGAIYLINEGQEQKVWKVEFEGNTIATDSRLKTQIESKPPILWILKGQVDRKKIDEDVDRLTAYYRSLGFFRARIGRELEWNESQKWVTLTFVIDEGPRYKVRNISLIGNTKFATDQLTAELKLKNSEFFDQPKMNADLGAIRDIYGAVGYVFTDVQAETRFLEEPGQVDLVYNVAEGKRYRVGRINVKIEGDHPHTKQQAVLNRIGDLRPGDIVDIRKVRSAERRLKASGLFLSNPAEGVTPKLVIVPPDLDADEIIADKPGSRDRVRGQSPDPPAWQYVIELVAEDETEASNLREPEPAYPVDPPADQVGEKVIIRGQSPEEDYPRDREIFLTQFSPAQSGRSLGGMGRPPAYQPAAPAPTYEPYSPPPATGPVLAPSSPMAPPDEYSPPGGYAAGPPPGGVYVEPENIPPPATPQPAPPGLFGNMFGNGPVPVDQNGFVPPSLEQPDGYVDIDTVVQETQTGRFMFGVGVNSDAGLVGSIVVDEQNFDWRRWPVNGWEDFRNGTAFRGAGQRFRLEAAPGTQVQRYLVNFSEPFLFDTPVSLGLSGFYFTRGYVDWLEERLGGTVNLGYQFTPDLSGTLGFTGQSVDVSNPRQPTPPALAEVLGNTSIYTFSAQLAHDTRDNTFLATEGHRIALKFEQTIGDFVYPRVTLEGRQFFPLRERPDGSGRHVLSLVGQVGVSGDDTPLYDRFYVGGFSTLRGFRFRGVGPTDLDVKTGGDFMLLGSVEYLFPITADDMLRGVAFVDSGTVEDDVEITDYRVAPGLGLRITVPALGPAPIALDFAFPVAFNNDDERQVFSFFVGFGR